MMNKTSKITSERPTFVDPTKAKERIKILEGNIANLNDAVEELKKIDTFFPVDTVEGLKTISEDWLQGYVTNIKKSICDDKRFPYSMKRELLERWQHIEDEAAPYCHTIEGVAQWTGLKLQKQVNGRFGYDVKAMQDFAEQEAKITLSDEDTYYLSLLTGLCASLKKVSEWEKAHGYYPLTSGDVDLRLPNGNWKQFTVCDVLANGDDKTFQFTPTDFLRWKHEGIIGHDDRKK